MTAKPTLALPTTCRRYLQKHVLAGWRLESCKLFCCAHTLPRDHPAHHTPTAIRQRMQVLQPYGNGGEEAGEGVGWRGMVVSKSQTALVGVVGTKACLNSVGMID